MRALIVGSGGQVGSALVSCAPSEIELVALTSKDLDVTKEAAVKTAVAACRPTHVFNAAAYTAVDRAEQEQEAAYAVNALAVGYLASAAKAANARFIHISTDFVFDGTAGAPYAPGDTTNPLSVYGLSKLAGEQLAGNTALIVRTSWVYAAAGHNFVRTMLRLMAERDELSVVADQVGSPTWAHSLAEALWPLGLGTESGTYHFTDSGVASWYDFAVAIAEEARDLELIDRPANIRPIATADYPTPAVRPHFSVLDKQSTFALLGRVSPHWRINLRRMLRELKTND